MLPAGSSQLWRTSLPGHPVHSPGVFTKLFSLLHFKSSEGWVELGKMWVKIRMLKPAVLPAPGEPHMQLVSATGSGWPWCWAVELSQTTGSPSGTTLEHLTQILSTLRGKPP